MMIGSHIAVPVGQRDSVLPSEPIGLTPKLQMWHAYHPHDTDRHRRVRVQACRDRRQRQARGLFGHLRKRGRRGSERGESHERRAWASSYSVYAPLALPLSCSFSVSLLFPFPFLARADLQEDAHRELLDRVVEEVDQVGPRPRATCRASRPCRTVS